MNGQELCILGWRYQFGIDTENDLEKAFKCYKQAADLGDGDGMFQVAEFYHLEIKVKIRQWKNSVEILKKFEEADEHIP
ncbi:3500_t:CDS:2, partial [Dentiscutata heterogama]